MDSKSEIILYQPDNEVRLEVRLEDETVWLTQAQMAELFQTTSQNITIHIRSIYSENELESEATCKDSLQVRREGNRVVRRIQKMYNLDVIISVGYRVKSVRGTRFRQWANKVLKEYLLKGYSINQRIDDLEHRVNDRLINHENRLDDIDSKIDFFVRTSLPPVEGIFYDGQIFDAYAFATNLIRSAKQSIVLIDNYVDESVLLMLSKRGEAVSADIYTQRERHNSQYPPIGIHTCRRSHDRFLIVDNSDVYHIGASLKDLGKKMFAFSKMGIPAGDILALAVSGG